MTYIILEYVQAQLSHYCVYCYKECCVVLYFAFSSDAILDQQTLTLASIIRYQESYEGFPTDCVFV